MFLRVRERDSALTDERELTGLARDRAEGLAVNLAPAVRDLSALLGDLAPLLSNLQVLAHACKCFYSHARSVDVRGQLRVDMKQMHMRAAIYTLSDG